jgi:hypothetical protein
MGTPRTPYSRRGSGQRAPRAATREGQGVGLAAQSTGEGGEPRPTGPPGGQATPGAPPVAMQLQSLAPPALDSPEMVCNNVGHVIDRAFVLAASHQTQKRSAPGLDHGTAQQYAEPLDEPLRDLPERLRDKRYVAPPVERGGASRTRGSRGPEGNPAARTRASSGRW